MRSLTAASAFFQPREGFSIRCLGRQTAGFETAFFSLSATSQLVTTSFVQSGLEAAPSAPRELQYREEPTSRIENMQMRCISLLCCAVAAPVH
jgi:hypothetical protein